MMSQCLSCHPNHPIDYQVFLILYCKYFSVSHLLSILIKATLTSTSHLFLKHLLTWFLSTVSFYFQSIIHSEAALIFEKQTNAKPFK